MKRKVIIILTTATSIIGVYVGLDKLGVFGSEEKGDLIITNNVETNQTQIVQGFNQNMPEEIYQENEIEEKQVPKEIRYLTTEELDKLKKARDPFATAPAIDEANVKKEKEYNELMQKIQKRIEALNKEEEAKRKKAEKEDKNYTTNQEEFDKKVYDEIDKILKGVSTNVSTNIVVESQTKDQNILSLAQKYAKEYNVDEKLVLAIIGNKTLEDRKIVLKNNDGTQTKGLMQISENTSKWLAKKLGIKYQKDMEFDAETNIKLGTYYLSQLKKTNSDEHYIATAYYMGPGGAERYYKKNGTYVSSHSSIIIKRK